MTCCFIGHRVLKHPAELSCRLRQVLHALTSRGVTCFLFGDHSVFNELCYQEVSSLKKTYPQIQRIHYRRNYPNADAYTLRYLTDGYEGSVCPKGVALSGRTSYIKRNQAMIRASDFCVFYCDEALLFKNETPYGKSGTALALKYAESQGKMIYNLFK